MAQYGIVKCLYEAYFRILLEVGDHPGTFRLLFYKYYEFRHIFSHTFFPYYIVGHIQVQGLSGLPDLFLKAMFLVQTEYSIIFILNKTTFIRLLMLLILASHVSMHDFQQFQT